MHPRRGIGAVTLLQHLGGPQGTGTFGVQGCEWPREVVPKLRASRSGGQQHHGQVWDRCRGGDKGPKTLQHHPCTPW